MIDYAMKRRTELLGAQPSAGSSLASSNGASPARIAPLGVYHGYLSRLVTTLYLSVTTRRAALWIIVEYQLKPQFIQNDRLPFAQKES